MGGHGALVLALRNPGRYRSRLGVRADLRTASTVPWGQNAFTAYLGEDRETWARGTRALLVARAQERAAAARRSGRRRIRSCTSS